MKKILVIEDEESVRENILDLLEAEDFHTIAAANGRVGVQLAISEIPDLILCDLMMPEIDGYGVLTALKEQSITAAIPFIFLTARSARSDFRQGMDLGADDYLTKPFTRAELLSAIASRLEKQAVLVKYLNANPKVKAFYAKFHKIETCLRNTLKQQDYQQFQVYYQPQVNTFTRKIIAAEGLVRWQSPELGTVLPTDLIPLAESNGLIIPIGEWILQSVCKQTKLWHNAGFPDLRIAVNLSVNQLTQPNFSQKVFEVLLINDLPPKCLELELTESMLMQDLNSIIVAIKEIQEMGVKIAIDDFGTGYSSLIYLKKLPINTLKIDRYFIHDVVNDPQKVAITTALIQMAHNLNLQVVAEGVETEAEFDFLYQHNCDAMQGFLFSHPLTVEEFDELLRADKEMLS